MLFIFGIIGVFAFVGLAILIPSKKDNTEQWESLKQNRNRLFPSKSTNQSK